MSILRASALPTFPPIVESAYQLKPGSSDAKAAEACTLCHVEAGQAKLNSYGKDVRGALDSAGAKQLTSAILHKLDDKDSDGDGVTNGAEFAADTLPGDPASKPAGAATVASAPVSSVERASNSLISNIIGLMFPKHAQHPAIVHLPIGVFMIGLVFDFLALWKQNRNLALAGYYNLTAAALTSLLAVGSGLLAWWFAYDHAALEGTLLYHLVLALVTMALIWTLWLIRFRATDKAAKLSKTYIILGILAFLVIAVTGHLGGNLTGVN